MSRTHTPTSPSTPPHAGEEGMFFRDVLRMYDKSSTALKTHTPSPGTGVTIELRETHEVLAGRPPRLPEIKAQQQLG